MRACAVLGNGPGLKAENVPEDSFLIGVNRSYEKVWSPIVCSADAVAAAEARRLSKALCVFVPRATCNHPIRQPSVAYMDPPKWGGNSGAFAIWVAVKLGFDRIYLVGFGGDGHFDGPDGREFKREYYRPNIDAAIEFAEASGAEVIRVGEEVVA